MFFSHEIVLSSKQYELNCISVVAWISFLFGSPFDMVCFLV